MPLHEWEGTIDHIEEVAGYTASASVAGGLFGVVGGGLSVFAHTLSVSPRMRAATEVLAGTSLLVTAGSMALGIGGLATIISCLTLQKIINDQKRK